MTRHLPVAVTGLGCLSAAGANLPACMESLFRGERQPLPPESFTSTHPVCYPVFEVPALGKTLAEVEPEIKNRLSHRAHAVRKARAILETLLVVSDGQRAG